MNRNIYALLVGIDEYVSPVSPLHGCVNDITAIKEYLEAPSMVLIPNASLTLPMVVNWLYGTLLLLFGRLASAYTVYGQSNAIVLQSAGLVLERKILDLPCQFTF